MKIFSEKTNKYYTTVGECLAAENEFDKKLAEKKAEEKALADTRKTRAAEVEKAYKESIEANKKYHKVLADFVKDYGSFHMTYHTEDLDPFFPFETFLHDSLF